MASEEGNPVLCLFNDSSVIAYKGNEGACPPNSFWNIRLMTLFAVKFLLPTRYLILAKCIS